MTVLKISKLQGFVCKTTTSRLQDFIINFLKNIFTIVLAQQIAIASLGGPGMIRKENNCNKIKVKEKEVEN